MPEDMRAKVQTRDLRLLSQGHYPLRYGQLLTSLKHALNNAKSFNYTYVHTVVDYKQNLVLPDYLVTPGLHQPFYSQPEH